MDNEIMPVEANAEEEVASVPARTSAPRPSAMNRNKRRKVCQFCADKIAHIDYKDVARLRKCISERSKILPRRVTGACAKHQRQITVAVKRARTVALLAYISD
jgi:small subunit ribosomal protein S18